VLLGGATEAAVEGQDMKLCTSIAQAFGENYEVDALAVPTDAATKVEYADVPGDVTAENVRSAVGVLDDDLLQQGAVDTSGPLVAVVQKFAGAPAELRLVIQQKARTIDLLRLSRDRGESAGSPRCNGFERRPTTRRRT
jgi:hypothetical protein